MHSSLVSADNFLAGSTGIGRKFDALRVDISACLLAPPEDPGDEVGYLGNGWNTK